MYIHGRRHDLSVLIHVTWSDMDLSKRTFFCGHTALERKKKGRKLDLSLQLENSLKVLFFSNERVNIRQDVIVNEQ